MDVHTYVKYGVCTAAGAQTAMRAAMNGINWAVAWTRDGKMGHASM